MKTLFLTQPGLPTDCGQDSQEQMPGIPLRLENDKLALGFDAASGTLTAVENKLTGETYNVSGDEFAIEAVEGNIEFSRFKPVAVKLAGDTLTAQYEGAGLTVQVRHRLGAGRHFVERSMWLTSDKKLAVKKITLGRFVFAMAGLDMVCYRHPDFDWVTEYVEAKHGWGLRRPEGSEPARTFFGRTAKGGFFTGVEMAYDNSRLENDALALGYSPNLKVKAGERLECETVYFGVYCRHGRDARAAEWVPIPAAQVVGSDAHSGFDGAAAAGLRVPDAGKKPASVPTKAKVLPLPSESAAMTAMASAILGPPRHGLMAFACGWHSQMEQDAYDTEAKIAGDLRSLEFLAACGLDGLGDCHPWGGESHKMAALREGEPYEIGEHSRRFLERARELKLKVVQWPTMNNTHPWRTHGGPFRKDRPAWLRGVEGDALGGANADNFQRREANCLACEPFYDWLQKIILDDALGTGLYDAWCMDGDFWGTGAYFHSTLPVTCLAADHEHLPGDSNYACQRRLDRLIAEVRRRHPNIYIAMCRPPMDLGVWANRHVDACFTLIESGTGGSNIAAGDEVRTASRIRVQHHFFPHWMDWSLLFPSYGGEPYPKWPEGHIDYLMLSAMACSPNLLLYLPTKSGIPETDKAEIRKWLDWGRANVQYLLVRKDLFDWPGKGKVDGSAHIVGDAGLVFLFNPGETALTGKFALTEESIGLSGAGEFSIAQEHPTPGRAQTARAGETIRWEVPAQTACVLRIQKLSPKK